MIIPKFSVDQNDEFIIVVAITPYIKASEADFYLLENQFKFYCKPYFLRLTFSHNIVENGKEKASFNVNTQEFTFYLPKEINGQKFNDLDLITKLLEKKSTNTSKIQVLNGESNQDDQDEDEEGDYEDEEWEFEQIVEPEPSLDELKNKIKYGFNDGYSDFFQGLQQDISDIIDIPIIDSITKQERTKVRTEFEDLKFDPERFMENHFFNDDIKELLHYKCYWEELIEKKLKLKNEKNQQQQQQQSEQESNEIINKKEEKKEEKQEEKQEEIKEKVEEIKQIDPSNLEDYDEGNDEVTNETTIESNEISDELLEKINSTLSKKISIVNDESESKNSLIEKEEETTKSTTTTTTATTTNNKYSKKLITFSDEEKDIMKNLPNKEYMISNEKSILLGLVDIIYSYAYNERVNMGYENIESAWNICKLSGTLSCLDNFYNLSSVLECCFKRSLTFPLYRSWLLSERVLRDTKQIFQLGKRSLLKCLLDIKKKLESSEFKYYLNRLYIDDYCIWLQHASKKKLKSLRNKLSEYEMKKSMISWPLEEYEKLVEEEGMVFGEEEEEDGENNKEEQFEYENQDESD
ncbi:hypothetical protein ACTFIY_011532 [Dictyostelium cf. discoideum]